MIDKSSTSPGLYNRLLARQNHGQEVAATHRQNNPQNKVQPETVTDTVSLSGNAQSSATYSSGYTNTSLQDAMKDGGFELLRNMVITIFREQGLTLNISAGSDEKEVKEINLGDITQQEAAELVSDDGYFGVRQTSDRIVDFAISMAGGDPSRIEAVKEGVERGFNEALEAFGGWLPDISYDTYNAVNDKLDAWVAESKEHKE